MLLKLFSSRCADTTHYVVCSCHVVLILPITLHVPVILSSCDVFPSCCYHSYHVVTVVVLLCCNVPVMLLLSDMFPLCCYYVKCFSHTGLTLPCEVFRLVINMWRVPVVLLYEVLSSCYYQVACSRHVVVSSVPTMLLPCGMFSSCYVKYFRHVVSMWHVPVAVY